MFYVLCKMQNTLSFNLKFLMIWKYWSLINFADQSLHLKMLPDNDDLLNQLSCELGLSDFMDDGSSILADGRTDANLYDQFLSSSENEEHALFNELIYSDGNSIWHIEELTTDLKAQGRNSQNF